MQKDGIDVRAYIFCADFYCVTDSLRPFGIDVSPMGKPLSNMLHNDWKVATF